MPSLKELQVRINSVKSTRKITSAMKMVAASRLKRAQDAAFNAREYNWGLKQAFAVIMKAVEAANAQGETVKIPEIMAGRVKKGDEKPKHLVIVFSSDKGLCGGFNSSIAKFAKGHLAKLKDSKNVLVMCVGKKAKDQLKQLYSGNFVDVPAVSGQTYRFSDVLALKVIEMFQNGEIDECSVVYNKFISAMTQVTKADQLIPVVMDKLPDEVTKGILDSYVYDFEPGLFEVLERSLFNLMRNRLFRANLESLASEHGARMTSMDSATRNAGDIINRLTLTYNRRRQAAITTELVEIISGAEALGG